LALLSLLSKRDPSLIISLTLHASSSTQRGFEVLTRCGRRVCVLSNYLTYSPLVETTGLPSGWLAKPFHPCCIHSASRTALTTCRALLLSGSSCNLQALLRAHSHCCCPVHACSSAKEVTSPDKHGCNPAEGHGSGAPVGPVGYPHGARHGCYCQAPAGLP
jgi:hypothetical protein